MPRDRNTKVPEAYFEDVYVGKDPEDRDNLIHLSDTGDIDIGNGDFVINADGITTTTGDITARLITATSDLSVAGVSGLAGGAVVGTSLEVGALANFNNTAFVGEAASFPGGETVSIATDTGNIATAGTLDVAGAVSVGDATATAGVINLGDGAASAADIVITGGGGITGATGVFDVGGTTPGAIAAGDASTTPGLLQLGDGSVSATDVEITGGGGIVLTAGVADIASTTPGTVSLGDATTTAGVINLGDAAASATDVTITGGAGIVLTTGGADIADTTPGTIVLGDATAIAGGLQLGDGATSATNAVLSGLTGYTSPFGAISLVQKTGVVQASTATYVLGATALTADAGGQDIVVGITNPDVPRNVTATANAAGCAGDVVVTGTNWAGEVITDTIALAGAAEVAGVKAFTTVTAVHLPPETHAGTDTVSIGVGNCLGLQRPIAAAGDVVEVARKAAAAAEYTIEATGTVSVANGTVDQSGVGAIVNNDRFEITYNASAI